MGRREQFLADSAAEKRAESARKVAEANMKSDAILAKHTALGAHPSGTFDKANQLAANEHHETLEEMFGVTKAAQMRREAKTRDLGTPEDSRE